MLFSLLSCSVHIVVNNIAIQLQTTQYRNWYCRDTCQYRGTTIYRELFDTGIEILVLTTLIEVSKVSHNASIGRPEFPNLFVA